MQLSVAVRNARADAIEATVGASAKLQIRTGAAPANCAAASTGTLLLEIACPSDWMAAAASGAKAKAGTWSGTGAANGDAGGGHYRVLDNAGTTCHIQGPVSQAASAWQASTAYALNAYVTNGGRVYQATTGGTSAGSGGPTGTGSGISDNTVVWAYRHDVGELTLDNTSIAVGQAVSVNSFGITEGNA